VRLSKSPPVRELWMLARRDAVKVPRFRAVIEYLIELFQQEKRLFAED
jgi:hypothetical protein